MEDAIVSDKHPIYKKNVTKTTMTHVFDKNRPDMTTRSFEIDDYNVVSVEKSCDESVKD